VRPAPPTRATWPLARVSAKGGQILRASITKKDVTKEHPGIGDVCVIPDASNTYFYGDDTDRTRRTSDQVARIALARSRIADGGRPGTWFKFHDGDFQEKGLGGTESPVVNPPSAFPSEVIEPSVVDVPPWKKYLMACVVVADKDFDNQKADQGGIAFCFSDHGRKWSEPKVLIVGLPVPLQDREYVAHPTLDLDNVTAQKADGFLLDCYSPRWGRPEDKRVPHHLARRSLTVTFGP
jgi:hypothetical protein